ncbi:unnamed protein product, partial [Prorocentrum cordatum]
MSSCASARGAPAWRRRSSRWARRWSSCRRFAACLTRISHESAEVADLHQRCRVLEAEKFDNPRGVCKQLEAERGPGLGAEALGRRCAELEAEREALRLQVGQLAASCDALEAVQVGQLRALADGLGGHDRQGELEESSAPSSAASARSTRSWRRR